MTSQLNNEKATTKKMENSELSDEQVEEAAGADSTGYTFYGRYFSPPSSTSQSGERVSLDGTTTITYTGLE